MKSRQHTRIIMGMPITVAIADPHAQRESFEPVFDYFYYVDEKFSTYKESSEITKINKQELSRDEFSRDMIEIFDLSEKTKHETDDYFDIKKSDGMYDPSGLVKGWAIQNAAKILKQNGFNNFYIEAGGDIEASGMNTEDKPWTVGIKNPFKTEEIIKVLNIENKGVATSGTYLRGQHIYNPKDTHTKLEKIVSITVIGPNIYEADRFATAAFAMGENGITFIENLLGFEGYMIDKNGMATATSGFEKYAQE